MSEVFILVIIIERVDEHLLGLVMLVSLCSSCRHSLTPSVQDIYKTLELINATGACILRHMSNNIIKHM